MFPQLHCARELGTKAHQPHLQMDGLYTLMTGRSASRMPSFNHLPLGISRRYLLWERHSQLIPLTLPGNQSASTLPSPPLKSPASASLLLSVQPLPAHLTTRISSKKMPYRNMPGAPTPSEEASEKYYGRSSQPSCMLREELAAQLHRHLIRRPPLSHHRKLLHRIPLPLPLQLPLPLMLLPVQELPLQPPSLPVLPLPAMPPPQLPPINQKTPMQRPPARMPIRGDAFATSRILALPQYLISRRLQSLSCR
mmetsp:Transcript_30179/g.88280  ORF Transcript_30179/g.88280 Transcript_30179/m.88280 type:complete len:252 (+) Transcript_30179:174-929(+)